MYCIKCGKKNQPDYTFCYNCGAPLVKSEQTDQPGPTKPPPTPVPSVNVRPPAAYRYSPLSRGGEVQRFPVAPNGKPLVVIDHPEAFLEYKNKDGKRAYAAYATIQARAFAVLSDTLVYNVMQMLLNGLLYLGGVRPQTVEVPYGNGSITMWPNWALLLGFTLYLLYCTLTTWLLGGRTLGKLLMRIKVMRTDGRPLDFETALRRNIFGYSLGLGYLFDSYGTFGGIVGTTLMLMVVGGFIAAFFSPQRRGWHDRLADTVVVGQRELVEGVNY